MFMNYQELSGMFMNDQELSRIISVDSKLELQLLLQLHRFLYNQLTIIYQILERYIWFKFDIELSNFVTIIFI